MHLPDKWLKRDSEMKAKLVQILAENLSKLTDKNLIGGINCWLTSQETVTQETIQEAISQKNAEKIANLFEHTLCTTDLLGIAEFLNINLLTALGFATENVDGVNIDYASLRYYMQSAELSAAISVVTPHTQETMASANIDASRTFTICSVGKVFTGVLMLKMLQAGIISEDMLDRKPPPLDENVLEQLSQEVCAQLKECTLRDLMLHKSGLGNHLQGYVDAIKESRDLSNIKSPTDVLQFAEKKIYPLDQTDHVSGEHMHYSNLGIILVGLAIEHSYKKHFGSSKPYNDILHEYIINADTGGAGLDSFSVCNPGNGITNPTDDIAPQMVGDPSGGYWLTVGDLGKFGNWLVEEAKNMAFKKLLENYGREFYNRSRNIIAHSGGIPSASAYFVCYLDTGTTVAILSNKPWQAIGLYKFIEDQTAKG